MVEKPGPPLLTLYRASYFHNIRTTLERGFTIFKTITALLLSISISTSAFAYCSEPYFFGSNPLFSGYTPSNPSRYSKPDVPFCLSEYNYSGKHICDEWEINNYFGEVEEYIDKLNTYIEEAQKFASEAKDYANKAIGFANEIQSFSNDVYTYSSCEAEEVKAQHE